MFVYTGNQAGACRNTRNKKDIMKNKGNLSEQRLAHAWEELQELADQGIALPPESNRLAFADPEFLLRRETRSIRLQIEMLKPELELERRQIDHTVVVYGSARVPSPEFAAQVIAAAERTGDAASLAQAERWRRGAASYEAARQFGRLVAEYSVGKPRQSHVYICTGGGPGIMEAANRGASEMGEPTIGLNITLPHEQQSNPYVTPDLNFKFHYFALRKMHFMVRAVALVVFPGGFGTLDELFEVMTLVQTRKSAQVPIVLYDSAYWKKLLNLELLAEEGMISPEDLNLLTYVDTPEDAWREIRDFYLAKCSDPKKVAVANGPCLVFNSHEPA